MMYWVVKDECDEDDNFGSKNLKPYNRRASLLLIDASDKGYYAIITCFSHGIRRWSMITAELTHNPYLVTTTVRFNGQAPKINSAIEKFESQSLVDWANEVPRIFHDELNGYDFDFFFTGTDADYNRVINAFRSRGIQEDAVRIIRKGRFDSVDKKREEISNLIEWLRDNRNRRFDYEGFLVAHSELIDPAIPYVIIQDETVQLDIPDVSVEAVESVFDLEGMDLTDTPILLTVSRKNKARFRDELQYVLGRADIQQHQLFFFIHPAMNPDRVIRIISDLGVTSPQVVNRADDRHVVEYINDYPKMDYVRDAIDAFRDALNSTNEALSRLNKFTEVANTGAQKEIESLDEQIELLRDAQRNIQSVSEYSFEEQFVEACRLLENHILIWRNRKTSATGKDQILRAAFDYSSELQSMVNDFEANATSTMQSEKWSVEESMNDIYKGIGFVPDFAPSTVSMNMPRKIAFPNMMDTLASLTETTSSTPRNDFFGFLGSSLEGGTVKTTVEVANYDQWRSTANKIIMPLAKQYVDSCAHELAGYHSALCEVYTEQIDSLIEQKIALKKKAASRLSNTERKDQEDKDWLTVFEELLTEIERG